ncbi:hypothetical protein [Cetobacterium somerae]
MSSYAYRDKLRTQIIFAREAKAVDKDVNFFCENPDCHAYMRLNALNSESVPPYFTANITNFEHIDNCYFASSTTSFNEAHYNESLFNFDEIVNEYLNDNVQQIPQRLYTLSQMYHLCKSKSVNDSYNNISIWKMLCDSRSNNFYTKGLYGPHLVECKVTSFNPKNLTINFKYPFNEALPNKYDLRVIINDKILFSNLLNLLLTRDKKLIKRPIIIFGNWQKYNGYFTSNIAIKSQIYIP